MIQDITTFQCMLQTLLGDRYGYRPFPTKIPVVEFEILRTVAEEMNKEHKTLLQEWFWKDENAVPPDYILQVGITGPVVLTISHRWKNKIIIIIIIIIISQEIFSDERYAVAQVQNEILSFPAHSIQVEVL